METIKNYLDSMFGGLPKTDEMAKLKENIYENMQDKYQELKASGKSENEAIGIVISEFGNIEELMEEFDIAQDDNYKYDAKPVIEALSEEPLPEVNIDTAREYIKVKRTVGKFVGIGVSLCVVGIALMIAVNGMMEFRYNNGSNGNLGQMLGLAIMFVFVAGGVALFIYSGFLTSPYEYIERQFYSSEYVKQQMTAEWNVERPTNLVKLVVGICMCVISPVPFFIISFVSKERAGMVLFGTAILLLIVAIAVYLIISAGNVMEGYQRILEIGDYTPSKKKGNRTIEVVASIVWPLVTAIYLFMGFVFDFWHPGWVIFPVVGILFGIFCSIVEGVTNK